MIVSHYSDINIEDSSLRPYQQKAKKEIFEAWDKVDNVMFQMPTGTGKTRLFTSIIRDINEYSKRVNETVKILIIAHRTELIDQIDESLNKYHVLHNVIAGGRRKDFKLPVNVASIQTLTHPSNIEYAKKLNVQFIIIDEAHHALASTYKKLWKLYPSSKKLGVTATPWRMNHQGFHDLFDTLIISKPVKDFIRQGYLSPYKYYSLRSDSDIQKTIDGIGLDRFGEYSEPSMEEKMDIGSIRAQLLDSYLSLAKGKKGIIYAINIEHARHICSEYEAAGYKTVCIDSKTPASERKDLVERFKKGQIDIIVNVDIFSEGFDCPDIEFIQLARPTRSLVKYLQQVGRGLRITKNKQECVILDNVGMYARFGLPDARRHWKQHFLGIDVPENPKSDAFEGTGISRDADMSEGTEDMELIQDVREENIESMVNDSVVKKFGPIQLLIANNFPCDNFIFSLKQSEKIFEAYIQDDKYFIISELIIDEDSHCVHRNRVGKILSDSWMYWQMLRGKIDNLKSISHYGSNYTVFHYNVQSSDGVSVLDKYFDYRGREIDNPQTVKEEYEKVLKSGEIKDIVDVPVSKASFKVEFDGHLYTLFRTVNGITRAIAKMPRTSCFGSSYEHDVALKNKERNSKRLPRIRLYNTDRICVLRSDDHSFAIKKIEKGKSFLLQYDLDGKLLNTSTIESPTSIESLPLNADDIKKIKIALDRNANSYKYLWFMSFLEIYKKTKVDFIPYKQIWIKMVSKAWKYVFMLDGQFSVSEKLPIFLIRLLQKTKLRKDSLESDIEKELNKQYDSLKLKSELSQLFKNVPCRFLSPWISSIYNSDKVMKMSMYKVLRSPYELYSDHIVISKLWRDFFLYYYNCLELRAEYGLEAYLRVKQDNKEANDFYNTRFPTLNKLLKNINRTRIMYVKPVRQFLRKHSISSEREISLSEIMKKIPESEYVIDSEGRKHVHVPGELWSLKILDKLLSGENMIESYDNVSLLSDYGLESFEKECQRTNNGEYFFNERFLSLNKLVNGIRKYNKDNKVRQFLVKYKLPLTGEISFEDILNIIPESKCVIDSEGRKRVNNPDGFWSLEGLDKLLSE